MRVNKRKAEIIMLLFVASLLVVLPIQMVKAQTATVSVSPQNNPVSVGQTLTINIEISNIQNLYGVDITLNWDTSMLKLESNQSFVGVSNGVLNAPVLVVQDTADQTIGEYHLVATSENPAGPFSGSATIATLTFKVTSTGQSKLTLNPQLASYVAPGSGETSEFISANVVNGVVTTSSSTSPSASQTPSSSPSRSPSSSPSTSSSPTATSPPLLKSPVFPILLAAIVVVVVVLVTLAVLLSRKKSEKTPS
jgi:hypothetical protein